MLDGVCRSWDDRGQLIEASLIDHGNGTEQVYYSSGILDHQYEYKDNKTTRVIGVTRMGSFPSAQRMRTASFPPGYSFNFTPGGTLAALMEIDKDGQFNGPLLQWTDTGKVSKQLFFVHGKKVTAEEYSAARPKDATLPGVLSMDAYAAKVPAELKALVEKMKAEKAVAIPVKDLADPEK